MDCKGSLWIQKLDLAVWKPFTPANALLASLTDGPTLVTLNSSVPSQWSARRLQIGGFSLLYLHVWQPLEEVV